MRIREQRVLAEQAAIAGKAQQGSAAGRRPQLIGEGGDRLHLGDLDAPALGALRIDERHRVAQPQGQRSPLAGELQLAGMQAQARAHGTPGAGRPSDRDARDGAGALSLPSSQLTHALASMASSLVSSMARYLR